LFSGLGLSPDAGVSDAALPVAGAVFRVACVAVL